MSTLLLCPLDEADTQQISGIMQANRSKRFLRLARPSVVVMRQSARAQGCLTLRKDDEACRKLLKAYIFGDKVAQTAVITHIEKVAGTTPLNHEP